MTELVNLDCPQAISEQVLSMIQSWTQAFSSDPDLGGVSEVYADLKMKGTVFPAPSTQDQILVSHSNQVRRSMDCDSVIVPSCVLVKQCLS